jgi:hypothetical protein
MSSKNSSHKEPISRGCKLDNPPPDYVELSGLAFTFEEIPSNVYEDVERRWLEIFGIPSSVLAMLSDGIDSQQVTLRAAFGFEKIKPLTVSEPTKEHMITFELP